jgi:hypothetical protein
LSTETRPDAPRDEGFASPSTSPRRFLRRIQPLVAPGPSPEGSSLPAGRANSAAFYQSPLPPRYGFGPISFPPRPTLVDDVDSSTRIPFSYCLDRIEICSVMQFAHVGKFLAPRSCGYNPGLDSCKQWNPK